MTATNYTINSYKDERGKTRWYVAESNIPVWEARNKREARVEAERLNGIANRA